ncbi:MAG: hypothetical protein AAGC95_05195 [Pseudomonadota bacterium]
MTDTLHDTRLALRDGLSHAITAITTVLVIAVIAFIIWEIFSPPDNSIIVKLKEKLGVAEAVALKAQQEAQADFEGDVRFAIAQAEAYRNAYDTLYSSYGKLMTGFYELEGQMVAAQQQKIGQTQIVDVLGANVASAACLLGFLDTSGELEKACETKDDIQNDIMSDYPELLTEHRSTLPQDLFRTLPRPEDLLNPEYTRLTDEYRSE